MTGIERLRGFARRMDELSVWPGGAKLLSIAGQIEDERAEETGREYEARCDWQKRCALMEAYVGMVLRDMERHVSGVEGMEDSPVARWARKLRDALVGTTMSRHESDAVAGSTSDAMADEDREAAAWVREHGGLDEVRKLTRHRTKEEVELVALGKLRCLAGVRQGEAASIAEMVESIARRLMPKGCEWPRYEDGELVNVGDKYECWCGETNVVESVTIMEGRSVLNRAQAHAFVVSDSEFTAHGRHVRRPAALAADGEPLEVGQTVWDVDGYGPLVVKALPSKGEQLVVLDNSGTNFYRYPEKLTHERPDSWERLEEDVANVHCADYCTKYGIDHSDTSFERAKARDIVRRAKALAERDA